MTQTTNEEVRSINCPDCGNWEEFPADMPRHRSQNFHYLYDVEGNESVYLCECGEHIESAIGGRDE